MMRGDKWPPFNLDFSCVSLRMEALPDMGTKRKDKMAPGHVKQVDCRRVR